MELRILLRERKSGEIELGVVYGLIALVVLAAVRFLPHSGLLPSCVFLAVTGLPCPTCGTTRSFLHLAHGDLPAALAQNPLAAAAMIAALAWMCASAALFLLRSPRPALVTTRSEGVLIRTAAVVLFLLNWSYLILML